MASQEKITVHNLADLKNTSDDAIPNYLNSLNFEQDHSLVDTRLALGYGAFAIAAACFLWDHKLGFEDTKWFTAAAVALYSAINGALTLWISFVEKGIVYQGTAPDGSKISIATSTKKNIPTYNLTIKTSSSSSNSKTSEITLSHSFTNWFDSQGRFVTLPFQLMLVTGVPLIAQADPKRAASVNVSDRPPHSQAAAVDFLSASDPAVLDAALAAAGGDATGTDASGKKSKRRKA
ncbi:microsomal signal peptidase 25 kDa subunit-domain-containing protein [Xylariaceae sp. FL0255]|nr:microsomal signal peptidase 25 kDa subunit-domain-containing protein [Xylariaceae sp. FL0255]